ncbi:MAG TPA: J domain-containing protein [Rhodanobacteraceae bacterium]|nr:J domain-containing protein [Rhodanobacteraceae bacterium]
MPSQRTHYDNLQVTRTASEAVIRASYRALIQKYHPDKYQPRPEGERITKILNDAYEILGNPQKKREYDEFLSSRERQSQASTSDPTQSAPAPTPSPTWSGVKPPPRATPPVSNPPARKWWHTALLSVALLLLLALLRALISGTDTPTPVLPIAAVQPTNQTDTIGGTDNPPDFSKDATQVDSARQERHSSNALDNLLAQSGGQMPASKVQNQMHSVLNDPAVPAPADSSGAVYRCQNVAGQVVFGNLPDLQDTHDCQRIFGYEVKRGLVLTPMSLPATGIIAHSYKKLKAPLDIVAEPGANYFVKLVAPGSRTPVLTAFIRDGEKLSVKAPLGTYDLHIASGKEWYGLKYLFGPETSLSEAEQDFSFEDTGSGYAGYTVELTPRLNGNLHVRNVDADVW